MQMDEFVGTDAQRVEDHVWLWSDSNAGSHWCSYYIAKVVTDESYIGQQLLVLFSCSSSIHISRSSISSSVNVKDM